MSLEAPRRLRAERIAALDSRREDWERLAAAGGNVFSTWEWAAAWWRGHGAGRELALIGFREDEGDLVGIMPLYLASSRPVRILRLLGHGAGDELGPVCAPGDRAAVAAATGGALAELGIGWDVMVAENLTGDDAWSAFEGGRQLSRIPNPVLEIGGTSWDEYMASRSGKFRQQVRRTERRLDRDHELVFRLSEDPARLSADLEALVELHDMRWGDESSGVFAGADGRLHREFAATALERGWLRLWFLELEGKPVAARLGYRFGGADAGYQSGRDPSWDKFGIGFLLQVHTIREAMHDGLAEYRFLRGGEGYKDRFANADRGLETIVASRGPRGRAAVAARRASLRLAALRGAKPWEGKSSG
jgi:CelD/BcsL family acetyltransferase involved in cellulose biosynthesis